MKAHLTIPSAAFSTLLAAALATGNPLLYLLAILSIMLGVMNLLPIPALDGGHIVICLYEMLTGRKPGDRFLVVTQMIGMILLLSLMVLAFGNDIRGLFIH